MAHQIWFLRHGEAEPHGGKPDPDRELTERGRQQSRDAGSAFLELGVTFDHAYTSPRARARETAAIACGALGIEPEVHESLSAGFDLDDALELLAGAGEDARVLVVGHEPDFSQAVFDLTGGRIDMKKGGIAGVRMARRRGELVVLLRPRETGGLAR